jgi:hypothetical protein
MPTLIKNLSDADPSVRDSSSGALGAVYKHWGEMFLLEWSRTSSTKSSSSPKAS